MHITKTLVQVSVRFSHSEPWINERVSGHRKVSEIVKDEFAGKPGMATT